MGILDIVRKRTPKSVHQSVIDLRECHESLLKSMGHLEDRKVDLRRAQGAIDSLQEKIGRLQLKDWALRKKLFQLLKQRVEEPKPQTKEEKDDGQEHRRSE